MNRSKPDPREIKKCLRVSGNRPAYYYVARRNYGDRWIVFFPDKPERERELSRDEFLNSYVTSIGPFAGPNLLAIWESFPEYRDSGN